MAQSRILIRADDRTAHRVRSAYLAAPERAWRMMGRLALVVGVVGLGDVLLAWYPTAGGDVGWIFSTLIASLDGLPLVTVGFLAALVAAIAQRRRALVRRLALANLLVAALALLMLLAFGALVPRVYALAPESSRLGLQKSVLTTALYGLGLGFAHLAAALGAWRLARAVPAQPTGASAASTPSAASRAE